MVLVRTLFTVSSVAVCVAVFATAAPAANGSPISWLRAVGRTITHAPRRPAQHASTRDRNTSSPSRTGATVAASGTAAPSGAATTSERADNQPAGAAAPQRSTADAHVAAPSSTVRPASTPPHGDTHGDFPYGLPVPGKPGFVTSPYAPSAGLVDVREMPHGVQVKDPYSGRTFLTP